MKSMFLLWCLLGTTLAWGQDPAVIFRQTHPHALGSLGQQAFCAEDSSLQFSGYRAESLQRIASLTKLFTTLVALDAFSAEQRWSTRFTLVGNRLHISGSGDPWFEEEKALALIHALRERGVTRLTEITFDEYFLFKDVADSSHKPLMIAEVKAALQRYFTSNGVFGTQARQFREFAQRFMTEQGADFPLPTSGIPTTSVKHSSINPLQRLPNAQVFTHTSRPMRDILKAMNVYSKNKVAHNLWAAANISTPNAERLAKYGVSRTEYQLHNGSGLPVVSGPRRQDNLATCRAILKVMAGIEQVARIRGVELEEIIGLGTDLGSYKDRFLNDISVKQSVMAKTGTLRHTSSLAGWIEGSSNFRFAILHHTTQTVASRVAQDRFLSQWMKTPAGPPQPRVYRHIPLYALDRDFLN